MDAVNTFDTTATNRAIRAEYALLAGASGYLLWRNRKNVRWPVAGALFYYNDALGYIPGAIAYRRSTDKRIPKGFYVAYNVAHSAITGAVTAGLWSRFVRPEWALLGIPLHIGIDRSVFGNFLKPFSVPFEPEMEAPAWATAKARLQEPWKGVPDAPVDGSGNGVPSAPEGATVGDGGR